MSGPQFVHFQSFSRKQNPGGQSVEQVLEEAARAPAFSAHVENPVPPETIFGVPIDEVPRLHDEMVTAGSVEVTLKGGRMARRGIRQDRHTLLTAVASYPVPTELVKATPEARAEYERWRDHNVAWLKATFGEKLVSVIAHWDEKHPHVHAYVLPLDDPTCSARDLNPAWRSKEEAMEVARAAGHDDKAALKMGNAAYRAKAREIQDDYFEQVSLPCGLTRTGPKRRRLSRQQWKAEKEAARREAKVIRDMEERLGVLVDAEDGLEASLVAKVEEIAEKLDLAEAALEEADLDRVEAKLIRKQAEETARAAETRVKQEIERQQAALEARQQGLLAEDRASLRQAQTATEDETRRLRDTLAKIEKERTQNLRDSARKAGRVVLELFLGVLDGSVRPHPEETKVWIIKDDDLRKRASDLNLIDLIRDTMQVLHNAWTNIASRLSQPEKDIAKEEAAKPVKAALNHDRGLQP